MSIPVEVTLQLWPVPASCGDARQEIRRFCAANGLDAVADDAVLLTSELVANAVEHTDGMVTVLAVASDESLVVAVRDDGNASPVVATPPIDAERGRGLGVIDTVAGDWGVNRRADGKTVWFRLDR